MGCLAASRAGSKKAARYWVVLSLWNLTGEEGFWYTTDSAEDGVSVIIERSKWYFGGSDVWMKH